MEANPSATGRQVWEALGKPVSLQGVINRMSELRRQGVLPPAGARSLAWKIKAWVRERPDVSARDAWEGMGRPGKLYQFAATLYRLRAGGALPRREVPPKRLRLVLSSEVSGAVCKEAGRMGCEPEALAERLLGIVMTDGLVRALLDEDGP